MDPSGNLTRVAGTDRVGYSGDGGPAIQAQLNSPGALVVDAAGNLYVAEFYRIRKISPAGIITTYAGTGGYASSGDGGPATLAQLDPIALALDTAGDLFVVDGSGTRVRKIAPNGIITTFAGNGARAYSGDGGLATSASFEGPEGVAVDSTGNVYISDTEANVIRKVNSSGIISTFAGTGTPGDSGDGGQALAATLDQPTALAIDAADDLYIEVDFESPGNTGIRKILPNGTIQSLPIPIWNLPGFAVDGSENIYGNAGLLSGRYQVAAFSPAGVATVLAGNGSGPFSGDGGPAVQAQLNAPAGIAFDAAGNLYFADTENNRIRRISVSGVITTVAGVGSRGFSGDGGPATSAMLADPFGITIDTSGNLYIADAGNDRIRMISPAGTITTIAGIGVQGYSGDGASATLAELAYPVGIAIDGAGDLYIADTGNCRVRMIAPSGIVTTAAGTGTCGSSGDGGQATLAELAYPIGVAIGPGGNLLVAMQTPGAIRNVTPAGVITSLTSYVNGLDFSLSALALDHSGNILTGGENVQMVSPAGVVTAIAGNGSACCTGDNGPAAAALLQGVGGIATDGSGAIYFSDSTSDAGSVGALRVLRPSTATPLSITSSSAYPGTTLAATGGTPPYTWSVSGLPPGISLDASSGAITGMPSQAGTFDFTVTVTDSGTTALTGTPAQVTSRNYTVTIAPPAPTISSLTPTAAPIGSPALAVTVAGANFDATSNILFTPPGGQQTQISPSLIQTAQLAATIPSTLLTTAGTAQVAVTNSGGIPSAAVPFTIAPLTIGAATPSTAQTGNVATSLTITGQYFTPGAVIQWTTPGGAQVQIAPSLIQAAQLAATIPANLLSTAGTAEIAVAEPGSTLSNSLPFTISEGPFTIQTSGIPNGMKGLPYLATLSAIGGSGPPYTWSIPAASLPPGLTLNASSGVVSGTPTASGMFTFTATVTDSTTPTPHSTTQNYSMLVGQQYVISTVAGGMPIPTPAPATTTALYDPGSVARDASGNVYFISANAIYRVDQSGTLTRVAGIGRQGYSGDGGPATLAQLNSPTDLVVDSSGDIYIAEINRVRKVTPGGTITTFAGTGSFGNSGDGGPAIDAQLAPEALALGSSGNLFVADFQNSRVRKIALNGIITTIAGNGGYGYSGDGGQATSASLGYMFGIAVDGAGNVYTSDSANNRVRRITPGGIISTFAGTGVPGDTGDGGPAVAAELNGPAGLAVDSASDLYIDDHVHGVLRKVLPNGTISSLPATSVFFQGFAVDNSGTLYGAIAGNRVAAISSLGAVTAIAGNGSYPSGGDNGPAALAQLFTPAGVAVDSMSDIYISDSLNNRVRKISAAGIITTFAGTGQAGNSGDGGPAASALIYNPAGLAIGPSGNLYIADMGNNSIRMVSPAGVITTVAGNGLKGYSGDGGPATGAQLNQPEAVALDPTGNLYIADVVNASIRMVSPAGIITTVAGTGTPGYSGDGGPATAAQLNFPDAVVVDSAGDLLIGDIGNNVIRKVSPGGIISTLANTLAGGLAADAAGNVYVTAAGVVQSVSATGVLTNLAGNGTASSTGDGGPALAASLGYTGGIASDGLGNIYLTDGNAAALRVLQPSTAPPLTISASPAPNGSTSAYAGGTFTASGGAPPYTWSVSGLPPGLSLDPSSGAITGAPSLAGTYDFTATVTDSGTVAQTGTPAQVVSQNDRISLSAPAVTITSLSPNTTPIGNPAAAISIAGANFDAASMVLFTSPTGQQTSLTPSQIQPGQIAVTIPAAMLATSGSGQIQVTNSSGTPSATLPFTVSPLTIGSIGPTSAEAGSGPATLTVSGQYFTSGATIQWTAPGGATVQIAPSLIQSAQLTATVPANLLANAGTAEIAVSDPGSTLSNALAFTIATPIAIGSAPLPVGQVSLPYSTTLSASGGIPPYSAWTVSANSLPPGLKLDPATGIISGTPSTAAGSPFNFSVTVQDSANTVSAALNESITILGTSTITLSGPTTWPMFGQPATLTATVAPSNATGKVTFYDGANVLGVGTLSSGQATFTTSLLPAGVRSIKAMYGGSPTLAPSLSTALSPTISALPGNGFQPASTAATGAATPAMVFADFNGDGKADIAFPSQSEVTVLLGNGDGTFLSALNTQMNSPQQNLVVGDFNGDGKPDIATAGAGGISVILGNGDGTFASPAPYSVGAAAYIVVADFNGDGIADLAGVSPAGSVSILLGVGDGTFHAESPYFGGSAGSNAYSVAIGDFNGDGNTDLAIGLSGAINVLLGNGDGTFQAPVNYPAGSGIVGDLAAIDLNGDGKIDLAIASGTNPAPVPANGAAAIVLLGNGDGTFRTAASYASGDNSLSVSTGDFNGDGIPDIVSADQQAQNTANPVLDILPGKGDGTFLTPAAYPAAALVQVVRVADFNGDGRADVATIDAGGNLNILLGAIPEPSVLCPAITTPTVTGGSFMLNCAASKGIAPYTWSISTGALPSGITLDPTTGVIGGTLSATGSFSFTVAATDSDTPPQTASQNITLSIATPLKMAAATLTSGTTGVAYSGTLATGGTTPYTCSVTKGSLPAGFTLAPTTCVLSGNTSSAATYTFTVGATDSGQPAQTASQSYSLAISSPPPPPPPVAPPPPVTPSISVTTTTIPAGTAGKPYTAFTLTASGGSGTLSWACANLPPGLSISTAGVITGTPQTAGVYTDVYITVTESGGSASGGALFTITINPNVTISGTAALPEIALGSAVSATAFSAKGGQSPYTWSGTNLPPGLSIDTASGLLKGTPTQAGNYSFSIQAVDSNQVASSAFTVTLSVLGITTTSPLPSASPATAYSETFNAAGGTGGYTFSASGVPAGLTFANFGVLSGFAKTPGTYSLTVQVTDAAKVSQSASFSLVVTASSPLSVPSATLSNATMGVPYSATLAGSGGAPPYTWTVTGGALPLGLAATSAGTISGTPLKAGTSSFTATATDTSGGTASGPITITVAPSAALSVSTPSLPNAIQGAAYPAQILTASGGVPPYTFSTSGTLPPGIVFASGAIGGNPSQAGTYPFTVNVTDSATPPNSAGASLSILVKPPQADLILSSSALSFSLTAGASTLPGGSSVTVQSSEVSQLLDYSISVTPAASWLNVTSGASTPGSLVVSLATPALALASSATPYQTSIVVTCVAPSPCAGDTQTISVSLTVTAQSPQLSVGTGLISLATASGTATVSGAFGIQNTGGGSLVIGSVTAADGWATVAGVPTSLTGGASQQIVVTANPAGLAAGYYLTTITVVSSAGSANVPVGLLVAQTASMDLSPAGVQFQAQQGSAPGSAGGSFLVTGSGSSTVNWTASVLPGASWLSVTTPSGTASSATPGTVNFAIDPVAAAALGAKTWFGTIQVASAGLANSPENFEVVLNVTAAGSGATLMPNPAGLIFISSGGGTLPPQAVQVLAGSATAVPWQASAATADGGAWLQVSPATGNASSASPGQSTVSVNPQSLAPGVYTGGVSYSGSPAAVPTVNITLIVAPAPPSPSDRRALAQPASCAATSLVPTQTGLVNNFAQDTGLPVPLSVYVVNDCGVPVSNAQVSVEFSDGDAPLTLAPTGSAGVYAGTWTPRIAASQVIVTGRVSAAGFATASTQVTGQVLPSNIPTLNPGGTLNVFNPVVGAALSPGMIVQIYGTNLSTQSVGASAIPLSDSLGGTSVTIGGLPAPLYYVSPGQINAQVPSELAAGGEYQIVVSSGGAQTTPASIGTTSVAPGVAAYTTGQAIAQHTDYSLVTASSPAKPGETIVFYLVGMGLTDTPVASGAASPANPLAHPLIAPTVMLNGVTAPASSVVFAGLTPGVVGLYQIDFQVPASAPNGNLPLVISQSGSQSNTTILPVHN